MAGNSTLGMLSGLFGPTPQALRQEDLDEERALQFAARDPFQAMAHTAYSSAALAGKGLGKAIVGAAGGDPRDPNERYADSMAKAKAAISDMPDVDLTTPAGVDSYYKGVIGILRQNGLPGEAHAAAMEWNEYKNKTADRNVKIDDLNRKKAADEQKAATERAKVEAAAERNRLLAQRGLGEFVGWIDRIEKTDDPRTKQMLIDRANAEIAKTNRSGKKLYLENAGDRVIVRDESGAQLGTDVMGEKPLSAKDAAKAKGADQQLASAYRSAMLAMQTSYKAAADLYNSRGLDNLIGKWTGIAAESGPEKGGAIREAFIARLNPAGQEALSLFNQVQGATFIQALMDLKNASKTGATGLGAVSEIEGNKIQQAKGSLWPRQQPASFRRKLADYIGTIEAAANLMAEKAKEDGLDPIHLNVVPLSGPTRGAGPAPAPVTPAVPQSGTAEPTVRMVHPKTGRLWDIKQSKVEEAKKRGFKEAQ